MNEDKPFMVASMIFNKSYDVNTDSFNSTIIDSMIECVELIVSDEEFLCELYEYLRDFAELNDDFKNALTLGDSMSLQDIDGIA